MSAYDQIILRGRAGSDVSLYAPQTEDKQTFARFRMAVPRGRRRDDGTWQDLDPLWYTVKAWGALARNISFSVARGMPLVVVGRPIADAWTTKEGELRAEVSIAAQTVGPDLAVGSFVIQEVPKTKTEQAPEGSSDAPEDEGVAVPA